MSVLDGFLSEISADLITICLLPTDTQVVLKHKADRINWRQLIFNGDLRVPFVLLLVGESTPSDWGLGQATFDTPVAITIIDKLANQIDTNVAAGVVYPTANIKVSSTDGMFAGQTLFFETTGAAYKVLSVTNSTDLVLTSTVSLTLGERVYSDLYRDILQRLELVKEACYTGNSFTNFQVVKDPLIDVSVANPANQAILSSNYPLYAGTIILEALTGETYA